MLDSKREKLILWFLVIGLAAVFLYAAIDSFIDPTVWLGFFPHWMRGFVSDQTLLLGFSLYEILLAVWLLSRKYIFYAALLSALTMLGILIFSLNQLDVTFRDISIFFSALALAALTYNKGEKESF